MTVHIMVIPGQQFNVVPDRSEGIKQNLGLYNCSVDSLTEVGFVWVKLRPKKYLCFRFLSVLTYFISSSPKSLFSMYSLQ